MRRPTSPNSDSLLGTVHLLAYGSVILIVGALAFVASCGDGTDEVRVVISGQHSIEVGGALALSATTKNGSDASYGWQSGDESIATVDARGVVKGRSPGETTITATGADTGASGGHALVVVLAGGKLPKVAIAGQHTVEVGKQLTLSATTIDGADTAYTWSSADTEVATVNSSGVVTGVGLGETTISAEGADTLASGTHAVVVVPAGSARVQISGSYAVLVGKTTALAASTVGGSDSSYTWSSAQPDVATVAADGTVTGMAAGQAKITATGADSGATGEIGVVVTDEIPNYTKWLTSAHADNKAEAFTHWDDETPPEVPTSCAKCHSTPGFKDFIGDDGSAPEQVDKAAPVGTVIDCTACHNKTADTLSTVTFPSSVKLSSLGPEARCMTCHQGRASADSVEDAITKAAPTDDDTVSSQLSFINIHYYAAGATLNAGKVRGGYQYAGKVYDWRFRHVPKLETCVGCHDPHSLEVKVDDCKTCHTGVATVADLRKVRMIASLNQDYDGDGNTSEGIADELDGLRALLLKAIQGYAVDKTLDKICYDKSSHPYWFKDTDGDGSCSAAEADSANKYVQWTARLLRAAYNYQVATKDPGAFAHNAKYIIQLLYDAVADLNTVLTASKVDLSKAVRNDFGHFNGASEAARHWDEDEQVSASCSKCHGGSEGFRFYLKHGVGTGVQEPDNGLDCYTCHETFGTTYDTVAVDSVTYPSGKTITKTGSLSNICGTCHSGREAKATIDAKIAANELGFRNVHYLPAAAIKAGSDAQVGYEYTGKTYAAEWTHAAGNDCTYCHDPKLSNHSFMVADSFSKCQACHGSAATPEAIRMPGHAADYDGDGSSTEPLKDEVATLASNLLTGIQLVAATGGAKICYAESAHPYWFQDTDGDGSCSATEAASDNSYKAWTAQLMKAAHNYQISQKEPGGWAHNFDYLAQLLIDSIADLGGSTTGLVRP